MDLPSEIQKYISSLTVTQGDHAGDPFTILPWQDRFLKAAFRDNIALACLTIARGNGKTAFVSALAAAAIDGPLAKPRADCVIVASSFQQALLSFEDTLSYLRARGHDLSNRKLWKVISGQKAEIENKSNGARIRAISSDPSRAHGLRPVLILADEPAQWPVNTTNRMYSALRTSLGKIRGGKFIALGTRAADSENWFEVAQRNPLAAAIRYTTTAAEREKNPFSLATIRKANPSYDHLPTLRDTIKRERKEAKSDPELLAQFVSLRLNGGVADVGQHLLMSAGEWTRIEADDDNQPDRRGPLVLGVDLAGGAAMTALAGYWPMTGRLDVIAAFPSLPDLHDRGIADGVDDLYLRMAKRGELIQSGEYAVDLASFLRNTLESWGMPSCIVGDRWKEKDLMQGLTTARIPKCPWVARGQGFKDGAEDVIAFRRACAEGYVKPSKSLLLRSAMREARTIADPARNEKLAKQSEGGRRQRARDDAVAACIVAVAEGYREAKRKGWINVG